MARVLLVINCQADASYQNREVLHSLYSDRFDGLAFAVNHSCPTDENYTNIVSHWQPAPLGPHNKCCCGDHAIGVHTFHPRLQAVAERADAYEFIVFAEDDCLLSPRLNSLRIQQLCANYDAVLPEIWLCDYADASWTWNPYAAYYSELEEVKRYFDVSRLGRHWANYSGKTFPPRSGVPMFAGFADFFILRTSLLREVVADWLVLEHMWHEIAIPTAILHHTDRIGPTKWLALWGDDRNRSLEDLMAMLHTVDWLHPVKASRYPSSRIRDAYRWIEVFSNVVDSGMKKGGVLWVYRRSPNVPTRHRSTPPWMILATRFASCH